MSKPLIGITANRIVETNSIARTAVNDSYLHAVMTAGGIPVVISNTAPNGLFEEMLGHLGGILFTGGVEDIDPASYRASMHPSISEVDPARDAVEIALVKQLVQEQKPFLGICRGVEIINVALGGTLYTHIPDQLPGALQHDYPYDPPLNQLVHTVHNEPGSQLHQVLGEPEVWVNSFHHQGIRELAPGLKATAISQDGLVEGLEVLGHPFGMGVQWHPEELTNHPPMLNLFKQLVAAAKK